MCKSDILEFVWKPEKTEGGISARERERRDFICRAYYGGTKKFVEWFNPESEEFCDVPEVALCDETFVRDDPDYAPDFEKINSLEVGESMILDNRNAIIMRVK